MRRLSGWKVESKIILLVLIMALLPVILVSLIAVREIEQRTLVIAEDQLRESAKTYALSLFDHLEHAGWEMRMLQLGDLSPAESSLINSFTVRGVEVAGGRSKLTGGADGLHLSEARDGMLTTGALEMESMFSSLGHVPAGVERCVQFSGKVWRCDGSLNASDTEDIRLLRADWRLPLSSVYETDLNMSVSMRQTEESALRHVVLISRLMPLIMLLIVCLAAWMLIHMIRRRMAPLSDLELATNAIREGRYETTVEINTNDEFERLGDAFNLMTRRLDRSFAKMNGLADMDRLVLDGGDLDEVIQLALSISSGYYGRSGYVYLWREHRKQGRLFELADGVLQKTTLCLLPAPGLDRDRVDHREALEAVLGVKFGPGAAVRVDGSESGELLLEDDGSAHDGNFSTLDELADRISVALTNMVRARSLYLQANYDSLTGLVNRQAFSDRVSDAMRRAERDAHQAAILFLDLDRFKQINDTEGHFVGDELLREIARRLEQQVRNTDAVARLGGDEFAIIVANSDSDGMLTGLCRRLIDSINEPVEIDGRRHEVDVSIGVSVYPDDGTDVGTLLMKADVAMYEAKAHSGSTFSFFDSALNELNEHRVQIESCLRTALADGNLTLHYQPKLELATGKISGLEGLLRWHEDDRLMFGPDEFIPVAEDTGLIHRFTELLISEIAACLERCDAQRLDPGRIAINVSTRQFVRQGFARQFLALLESASVATNRVEIEITESLFIQDANRVGAELAVLRAAGVHIALDDFGTGYSSLNMLRSLPLNTVKIDRSFVQPLRDSAEARKVAEKIIEMVSALGLSVVAEGVEHWQEVSLLERLGCDCIQGYVLDRPMPLDVLIGYLKRVERDGVRPGYRVIANG
jgi:diguanylate cyclase (GGDEF)-like protein